MHQRRDARLGQTSLAPAQCIIPPESAASWLISMPFEKCTITILTKTAHLFGQRGPPVTLHLDCPANHLHLDFPPIIGPSAASSTVPIGAPIVV
jgi:hypothetical protein